VVFFSYGVPMGTNSHSHSEREVRIPLAVSASRGAKSQRNEKVERMAESYPEQHIPEKICLALVEEHHLAWCFFLIRTKGIRSRSRVENSSGGRVFPANDQDAQFASRVESLNMFIHKFNTTSCGVFFLWCTHGNELPFA